MLEKITLIGMPGAGKSTVGHLLAKQLDFQFIDTDDLIRQQQGRSLQDIVDKDGYIQLRHFEEQAILSIKTNKAIIATGGSTVYSIDAMKYLSLQSRIVYLSVPYEIIEQRIMNLDSRGLAKQPHQSLHDLFVERKELYEKYADIVVLADGDVEVVVEDVKAATVVG